MGTDRTTVCIPSEYLQTRMVAAIAGPFGRNFSQGEIGGVLGDLGYGIDSVWKL